MTYLITQTFVLLLVAALLGLMLGWYLTRIAAVADRRALLGRVRSAEAAAGELRSELEAATAAKGGLEGERNALSREIADLKAELDSDETRIEAEQTELAVLQQELDQCRAALAAAESAPQAELVPEASVVAPEPGTSVETGAHATGADDLQRIKGIGPKIAGLLNELGVHRFEQIAAWQATDIEWINGSLKFKGRVEREDWVGQARSLLAGQ